jgi:hypothetical protein
MTGPFSLRNPKAEPQAVAPDSSADVIVGGLGVAAAAASASFAAYMVLFGPANPVPSGTPDFGIFAQFDHRPRATAAAEAPQQRSPGLERARTAMQETVPPQPDAARRIDFTPTGTVRPAAAPTADGVSPAATGLDADEGVPLAGFVLRDVFDGNALIESRNTLSVVQPGSEIDGAGKVLAIERRGDAWVVTTARGFIGTQRP